MHTGSGPGCLMHSTVGENKKEREEQSKKDRLEKQEEKLQNVPKAKSILLWGKH